ncbi:hypothetical protein DSUL_150070 [Desulfovibrionales bacterium]
MKISMGCNLQTGPYGGGNQVAQAVANHLCAQGVEVTFDLKSKDLDLILLFDPRPNLRITAYTQRQIIPYLWFINSKAIVVHRINECDERKNSTGINRLLRRVNGCADHTIFISDFLRDLHLSNGLKTLDNTVIRIGVNRGTFHPNSYQRWDGMEKLKLISHHWSGNWMKGFDIYQHLDDMLARPEWKDKLHFTYLGNLPSNFQFKNATYLTPVNQTETAAILRQHHVYITASYFEPAGLHHAEGAMCGLPVLYRKSGALPEYNRSFGLGFTDETFEDTLCRMYTEYTRWADAVQNYPADAEDRMCREYYNLFTNLVACAPELRRHRSLRRQLRAFTV